MKEMKKAEEDRKMEEHIKNAKIRYMESGLSKRLQTENPFEEFKLAVERAVIENQMNTDVKVWKPDQSFFDAS